MQCVRGSDCNNSIPGSICISQPFPKPSLKSSATKIPRCHYQIINNYQSLPSTHWSWNKSLAGQALLGFTWSFVSWALLQWNFPGRCCLSCKIPSGRVEGLILFFLKKQRIFCIFNYQSRRAPINIWVFFLQEFWPVYISSFHDIKLLFLDIRSPFHPPIFTAICSKAVNPSLVKRLMWCWQQGLGFLFFKPLWYSTPAKPLSVTEEIKPEKLICAPSCRWCFLPWKQAMKY